MNNSARMLGLPSNVWILTISQALLLSVSSLVVFAGGLVGSKLAPLENLSTLPVASIVVGTAVTIPPVTLLMKTIGRRKSFFAIGIFSIFVALLASYAISISNFYLFCLSTFLLGTTYSCVMQFRFAAMESVSKELLSKAASMVLIGGIAAAFLGPETAMLGKDLLGAEFSGSFLLLAVLFIIGILFLLRFENPIIQEESEDSVQRPQKAIVNQRVFWIANIKCNNWVCGYEFYNDCYSGKYACYGRTFTQPYEMGDSKSYCCHVFTFINYGLDNSKIRCFKNGDIGISGLFNLYFYCFFRETDWQLLGVARAFRYWLELPFYWCYNIASSIVQTQRAF